MNKIEFDYYLIRPVFDGYIPMVMDDDDYPPYQDPVRLCLAPPIPKQPRMADYHSLDGATSVFSQKVYEILNSLSIKGFNLNKAIIRDVNNEEYDNYYIAKINNKIASFDKAKSKYMNISSLDGSWMGIRQIVLDPDLLLKIPLEDRLVYKAKEHSGYTLYHKSVVDKIMAINPVGVSFTSVEEWYEGRQFRR